MSASIHHARPANAADLIASLKAADRIAIDTEFHTERSWLPELFLVQLALPNGDAWVIDPLDVETFQRVAPAIAATPCWVVHGGQQDVRVLSVALGGVPAAVYDTQVAAALVTDQHPAGLGRLLEQQLGVTLPKRATLSDWSRRPLTADQLRYAAEDASSLLALWDHLFDVATRRGRADLVLAACAEFRAQNLRAPDELDQLRELGGTLHDPREAWILGRLAVWRETLAQREDRPARTLVGDQALRQIARLQPTKLSDFDDLRRLPRGFVRAHGEAILGVVHSALADPAERWPPLAVPGSQAAARSAALRMVLELLGIKESFAAHWVMSNWTRDAVVLAPDPERRRERLGAWRTELVGDWIDAALDRDVVITIHRGVISSLSQ